MKILLINSAINKIYSWFEAWVEEELRKRHTVRTFHFTNELNSLDSLVSSYKPELLLTFTGFGFPTDLLQSFRNKGIKLAVWLTEDPYYIDHTINLVNSFDFVFTIDSSAKEIYENRGHRQVHHLPLGTNPDVFKPKTVEEKYKSDICLVGYPYPDRIKYVRYILQYTNFKVLLVGEWKAYARRLRRLKNVTIHDGWISPPTVANYYNGSKIILNSHRPVNLVYNQNKQKIIGKSINNRTFDVASCGSFQLIDFKEDLPKHFKEGEEIIAFRNFEELLEKTKYYMNAEEERKIIAKKARIRVLKEHTFQHRLNQIISVIETEKRQ